MNNSDETTNFHYLMLDRLKNDFQVDTSPAQNLIGDDLKKWIYKTEDELTNRLFSEWREVRKKSASILDRSI